MRFFSCLLLARLPVPDTSHLLSRLMSAALLWIETAAQIFHGSLTLVSNGHSHTHVQNCVEPSWPAVQPQLPNKSPPAPAAQQTATEACTVDHF